MNSAPSQPQIEYRSVDLRSLKVECSNTNGRSQVSAVLVEGEQFASSKRFWGSLFHRFGINSQVFKYFGHDEVFNRIVERVPGTETRLCIERHGTDKRPILHATTAPTRPLLNYGDAIGLAQRHEGAKIGLNNGLVTAEFTPRSGERTFRIRGDDFANRYVMEMPIDGWGNPRIFVSLLRLICSNGAIGYARAFRSDIALGGDGLHSLERAMGQFDHEEGYAAIRSRFEAAQTSWGSVREVLRLRSVLSTFGPSAALMIKRLEDVAGDLCYIYGLTNPEALSARRQRVLPVRCKVYDLLNFASEVATHKVGGNMAAKLQAWIGGTICEEYDLEGTATKVNDFADLFLDNQETKEALAEHDVFQ